MKKITLFLLAGLLVVGLFVGSVAADTDTLVIGTTDRVDELSPANSYDHYSWHVMRMCSDSLLEIKPKSIEVGPALAKDWEVGPQAKVYTFYLQEDATFWDGEPVTASAVKWSLERSLRLNGPKGGVHLIGDIDTIEVLDEHTVKITLERGDATFLKRVTGQVAPALIWNPKSTPENEFAEGNFVGVGPYKLEKFEPNQSVVYTAYDDYYGDKAKTETVIELKYANNTQLRTAIEAGDIDVAFRTLNPIDIQALEDNPNFKVQRTQNFPSVRYILFNVTNEVFKEEKVRQAISYAVDRKTIVEQVFSGIATSLYSMVPKGWTGRLDTFPKRDLDKAEQLLAEAGYTADNPLEATLWFTPKHYGTTEADVAAVLKGSLEEIPALDIEVRSLEWGAYLDRSSSGGFGMFLLGWYPDYLEASNFLAPWITESPENLGTYFNHHPNYPAYDRILAVAKSIPDTTRRGELYEAVQIMSSHDVMFIPLWANLAQAYVVMKPEVKNCFVDATMDIRVEGIYKE